MNKTHLLVLFLLMLLPMAAKAYDAEIDGIYYNLNTEAKTAEVTSREGYYYSGDVVIPAAVNFNATPFNVTAIGGAAHPQRGIIIVRTSNGQTKKCIVR